MTPSVAAWLAGLIALLIAADLALNAGNGLLFAARKFLDLVAYVAFWR
ncbi:hypothetical protein Q9295_04080 [Xinfangfangia sp. CPCC 101601]|uniref:Glyceraldehyde-3-phosphate dehydrogenase n=1 Tax=Pseudogemmobacter lacusdianii TaxID=3069608 RepID=A0ABU0VUY2_9RHOB|nr:hypothetical protein [Xinfangfangia sp. CPCC 101601]MDQ2065539.1 hypothetical protein [Xinfangfangia sp. CPCC 101601]